MLHFYKNFKLLEDGIVSSEVREVTWFVMLICFDIHDMPMNGFVTYVKSEWPCLEEKENAMYLTSMYI